jgi:hypothetical protein
MYNEDADDIIEYDDDDDYEEEDDADTFDTFMKGVLFAKSMKVKKDRVIFNYGDE